MTIRGWRPVPTHRPAARVWALVVTALLVGACRRRPHLDITEVGAPRYHIAIHDDTRVDPGTLFFVDVQPESQRIIEVDRYGVVQWEYLADPALTWRWP